MLCWKFAILAEKTRNDMKTPTVFQELGSRVSSVARPHSRNMSPRQKYAGMNENRRPTLSFIVRPILPPFTTFLQWNVLYELSNVVS